MNENVDDLVKRLREAVDNGREVEPFTRDDVASIRKIIKLVDLLESWGRLGKTLLWLLTGVAGALIAYEQIASRVVGK